MERQPENSLPSDRRIAERKMESGGNPDLVRWVVIRGREDFANKPLPSPVPA